MPWLSRAPRYLLTPQALAKFGRHEMLGSRISGVPDSAARAMIEPLTSQLYGDVNLKKQAIEEIRKHAREGEWEAVGAWKLSYGYVDDAALESDMTDGALLAFSRMRITNLTIHLGAAHVRRFEELMGESPPNDGFVGPPVFDSHFGPTRQYYFDHEITASAARTPQRISSRIGVLPGELDDLAPALWDFGMLVLRGPLLVNPDNRFEPSVVRPAVAAATDVDHGLFCEQLSVKLIQQALDRFNGWSLMGAARFLEDYLDPALTGGSVHAKLLDAGLEQLAASGALGGGISLEVLSEFERERL